MALLVWRNSASFVTVQHTVQRRFFKTKSELCLQNIMKTFIDGRLSQLEDRTLLSKFKHFWCRWKAAVARQKYTETKSELCLQNIMKTFVDGCSSQLGNRMLRANYEQFWYKWKAATIDRMCKREKELSHFSNLARCENFVLLLSPIFYKLFLLQASNFTCCTFACAINFRIGKSRRRKNEVVAAPWKAQPQRPPAPI